MTNLGDTNVVQDIIALLFLFSCLHFLLSFFIRDMNRNVFERNFLTMTSTCYT
jgi:ABC-type multidrug transport system permease subunit